MTTFGILTLVQFCGGLFGIMLTWMATMANYNTLDTFDGKSTYDTKTYHPAAPIQCPRKFAVEPDPKPFYDNACSQFGINWNVFFVEFVASFVFIFSWLVIRNYKTDDESRWDVFVKPFLIVYVYALCEAFSGTIAGGKMNPTQAFAQWVWMAGAYNDQTQWWQQEGDPPTTVYHVANRYQFYKMGSFMWLYVLAPYLGAIPAGLLAQYHLKNQSDEERPEVGENEVFLKKQEEQ